MPKARRSFRRKSFRPYKKRPLGRRQAKAVASIAKKQIRKTSEWKHFTGLTDISISTSGSITDISMVPQGDTDTTRDGDSIFASSVIFRGVMTNGDATNRVRVIFFQSKAKVITVSDLLIVTAGAEVDSMYNTDNFQNFKILYDRVHYLQAPFSGATVTKTVAGKVRLSSRKMQYEGGGVTGINKVYMLTISDSAAATHPTYKLLTKLNFRDG